MKKSHTKTASPVVAVFHKKKWISNREYLNLIELGKIKIKGG